LHIFARIAPKPEFFDVTRDAILEIIPMTLAEPVKLLVISAPTTRGDRQPVSRDP